jgi:hypothetical protein
MLNWNDEITAVTPSEARAYRKIGGRGSIAKSVTGGAVNKVILIEGISQAGFVRYVDDIFEFEAFEHDGECRTAWSRDASVLRAAVLRRWLGEIRGRALSTLRPAILFGHPETGSAKAIAKRITPLGAPPQIV